MNHLKSLMKIMKAAKVISAVAKVSCLIGIILFSLGIVGSVFLYSQTASINALLADPQFDAAIEEVFEGSDGYGDFVLSYVLNNADALVNNLLNFSVISLFICIVGFVLGRENYHYYKAVTLAGTPFTYEGAEELKKLGIHVILYNIGASFICGIVESVLTLVLSGLFPISSAYAFAFPVLGFIYLFLSLVFRYGAFLEKKANGTEYSL